MSPIMSELETNLPEKRPITSEIHLEEDIKQNDFLINSTKLTSRIEFRLPLTNKNSTVFVDQDGDLSMDRHNKHYILYIEHEIGTNLDDVGLQLWRSAFFLGDYLMNNLNLIKDKIVFELGAGLGIVSFIASFYSKMVYCTDLQKVIHKAKQNWSKNQENLKELIDEKNPVISFKNLDWSKYETMLHNLHKIESEYDFNYSDLEILTQADVFVAADVIYDTTITLNFFNTIFKLMTQKERKNRTCIIANEKRLNFDLSSLSITDVAYELFEKCLNDLDDYEHSESGYIFHVQKLDTNNLDYYFMNYKRTNYLEIWLIKASQIN